MAFYTVELQSFRLLSTANRRPYWDEIAISSMLVLETTVKDEEGARVQALIPKSELKAAWLGLIGADAVCNLSTVKPAVGGDTWQFEVPDIEPSQSLKLLVTAHNVRDLGKKETERLIAKSAVLVGEIAAGVALEPATHLGKIVVAGALGLFGWAFEETIDELFKDKPECRGPFAPISYDCSSHSLDAIEASDWNEWAFKNDGARQLTLVEKRRARRDAYPNCGAP